ncbi:MAG: enoyl-CoA hydratase/isomerase family protein [Chloroflexi bacterium]|nr:enoyl-CoA hydratase/isomerase family protein [Chloroflexota bacterium]
MVFEPTYGTVLYELEDGVATMTLNVPERLNAFSGQMHADMLETYLEVNRDPDVKVLIITGTGRALSVGADIKEEAGGQAGGRGGADRRIPMLDFIGSYQHKEYPGLSKFGLADRAKGIPSKPVVTAVNGMCAGGGLHFLDTADIVICADDSTFFDPHVNVAIAACGETLGMVRNRQMPRGEALRVAMMGLRYRISAERAYQIGLVSEVVPRDQLIPRAKELAARLAQSSPRAVSATVAALWDTWSLPYSQARQFGAVYDQTVRREPDAREGILARVEGRAPNWTTPTSENGAVPAATTGQL